MIDVRPELALEATYRSAPVGMCVVDRELRFVRINERLAAMNGRPVAEHIGRTLAEVLPALVDSALPLFEKVFSTGEPLVDLEIRGETPARPGVERVWIEQWYPIKDTEGRTIAVNIVAEEVTEQRRVEAALERSRGELERYRLLASKVLDIVLFLRASDGQVLQANDAALDAYGYGRERMLQMNIRDLRAPEELGALEGQFVRARNAPHLFIATHRRSDGSRFPVEVSTTSATVGGEQVVMSIIRDITERTRMEAERERHIAALQAADRRKDEFLAMLSHELRNPLAPISNAAEILRRLPSADARMLEQADMIGRQVAHMTRLVDDLLDVSRVTRGAIALEREPLDLAVVLRQAVDIAMPLVEERRQTLVLDGGTRPTTVMGDATRLAQVFANLLNNAARYTPPEGRIDLRLRHEDGHAVVTVADDGIGITADLLPRIFDLFTQGERSIDRSQGGLGLGLALVRSLVRMHGGTVEAFSEGAGRGTTVTVGLPLCTTLGRPERPSTAPAGALE